MVAFLKSGFSFTSIIFKKICKVTLVVAVIFTVINIFYLSIHPNSQKNQSNKSSYQEQRSEIYKIINNPTTNKTLHGRNSIAAFRMLTCFSVGEGCNNNPQSTQNNYGKSLIGRMTGAIALPFVNPPASGVYYAYESMSKFGFLPQVYAAEGIGLGSLQPLFQLWSTLRDISFMVIVVIIIVMGFLIIFRAKINPQTVMGIESALPRIIITLLLITFSFAIVGLLFDLMYIFMAVIITALGPIAGIPSDQMVAKFLLGGPDDIFSLFSNPAAPKNIWISNILFGLPNALMRAVPVVGDVVQISGTVLGFWKIFPWIWHNIFSGAGAEFFNLDFSAGIFAADGPILGAITRILFIYIMLPVAFSVAAFVIPLLIGLLILLTVITLFFRILMMIFRSYITVLILTALSPLILLLEAVPGRSTFSNWFRSIASELIVFPALVAILLIGVIITQATDKGFLIQFPFLYGVNANALSMIVGMMLLFMIPSLIKLVKTAIQPKPLSLPAGLGVFFGGAASGIGAIGAGGVMKSMFIDRIGSGPLPGALKQFFPTKKGEADKQRDIMEDAVRAAHGFPARVPGGGGGGGGGAPCLSPSTNINTQHGHIPIRKLKKGMLVWTLDSTGKKILKPISKLSKIHAQKGHLATRIVFADRRTITASLGHPTIANTTLANLIVGVSYDDTIVVENTIITYRNKYTYDLLVDGETGFYFANNIPLGSTLKSLSITEVPESAGYQLL